MISTHDFNTFIFMDMYDWLYNHRLDTKLVNDKQVEEEKKQELNSNWLIQFDFENVDGNFCHFSHTIGATYDDWWGECNWVPENGAFIHNVQIICASNYKCWILKDEELDFDHFMREIMYYFNLDNPKK